MPKKGKTFVCASCGEELASSELSSRSLSLSGEKKKVDAVDVLPPQALVCTRCQQEEPEERTRQPQVGERTEAERWLFSGIEVEPAILQVYELNY
jgi:hypothetical protein